MVDRNILRKPNIAENFGVKSVSDNIRPSFIFYNGSYPIGSGGSGSGSGGSGSGSGGSGSGSGSSEPIVETLQATKTVYPSIVAQIIKPDSGYYAMAEVVIAAIPVIHVQNEFGGDTVTIGAATGLSPNTELIQATKTVSPSFEDQTITPDTGYLSLASIEVLGILVTYEQNQAGGDTVTIG